MATILSVICQKTKQFDLIPAAIIIGFALDFVLVVNFLKN